MKHMDTTQFKVVQAKWFKSILDHVVQLSIVAGIVGAAGFFLISQYFITNELYASEKLIIEEKFVQVSQDIAKIAEDVDLKILKRQINQLRLQIKFAKDGSNEKIILEATMEEFEAERDAIIGSRIVGN